MRQQFSKTVHETLEKDVKASILIAVFVKKSKI